MNLLELVNVRKVYTTLLVDLIDELDVHFLNIENLSAALNRIEKTIDTLMLVEREINRNYNSVYISETETIADVYSYVEGLDRKIDVLSNLMIDTQKKEIVSKIDIDLDYDNILKSIGRYENLKKSLLEQIQKVCLETEIKKFKI